MVWTGVLHWNSCLEFPKRELLLFDKVAVIDLDDHLDELRRGQYLQPELADQLEWAEEQGLIIHVDTPPEQFFLQSGREKDLVAIDALELLCDEKIEKNALTELSSVQPLDPPSYYPVQQPDGTHIYLPGETIHSIFLAQVAQHSLIARAAASYLTSMGDVTAVSAEPMPELADLVQLGAGRPFSPDSVSDVAQVVIKNMPTPSEPTPLEDLLDFKNDPEIRRQLLALRILIRDLAKAQLPRSELEEKLEWLLREYERHMKLHRLKLQWGPLETVVTTTLEIAEDLMKIKWSKAAQALFSLKRRKLPLLEAEAGAPGREISYVSTMRRTFGDEGGLTTPWSCPLND